MTPKNIDAKNKKVLIVDDIISTGGTIVAATEELKRLGARSVSAACTHGLFVGGALDKLEEVLRQAGLRQHPGERGLGRSRWRRKWPRPCDRS